MKVYIVKEHFDQPKILGVYSSYYDAEERAEEIAEYGGFDREDETWTYQDLIMLAIEEHEVI